MTEDVDPNEQHGPEADNASPPEDLQTLLSAIRPELQIATSSSGGVDKTLSSFSPAPFSGRKVGDFTTLRPIYGQLFPGTVSILAAPGGAGKSTLAVAEALAMASGEDLLHEFGKFGAQIQKLNVCYLNLEDDADWSERQFAAAAEFFGIDEIGGKLLIGDRDRCPEFLAAIIDPRSRQILPNEALVESVVQFIEENQIDILVIDPLIATNPLDEADNIAAERVATTYRNIARRTHCHVMLVHHVRKSTTYNGRRRLEADDVRGASALLGAARLVRVVNTLDNDSGVDLENPTRTIEVQTVKNNRGQSGNVVYREKVAVPFFDRENGEVYAKIATVQPVGDSIQSELQIFEKVRDLFESRKLLASKGGRKAEQGSRQGREVLSKIAGISVKKAENKINYWMSLGWIRVVDDKDENRKTKKFYAAGPDAPTSIIKNDGIDESATSSNGWLNISDEERGRREREALAKEREEQSHRAELETKREEWLAAIEASAEPKIKRERQIRQKALEVLRNAELLYSLMYEVGLSEAQIFGFDPSASKTHPRQGLIAKLEGRDFRASDEGCVEAEKRNGDWETIDPAKFAREDGAQLLTRPKIETSASGET